jgi:DMSO/TMAO reductase YedYZ heme-binding membrane subunit
MDRTVTGTRTFVGRAATSVVVLALCVTAGYLLGDLVSPITHNRMFPWMVARATGVGAFIAISAMTIVGLRFRHPARASKGAHKETLLRIHVALGPALTALIVAHVWALLADKYAGVSRASLLIPDAAKYRPGATTLGVLAAWMICAVLVTSALAGRRPIGSRWALAHKLVYPAFALIWLHGVLAGSDTPALRWLYAGIGAAVAFSAMPVLRRGSRLPARDTVTA